MHTLHLLFTIHLQPLIHIYAKVVAFLFKSHLGPLVWIEAIWAWWVMRISFIKDLYLVVFTSLSLSLVSLLLYGVLNCVTIVAQSVIQV